MTDSRKKCTDEEFVHIFERLGPSGVAEHTGQAVRTVLARRKTIEGIIGRVLVSPIGQGSILKQSDLYPRNYPVRFPIEIFTGTAIVASDMHYWPEIVSPAHRGAVHLAKEFDDLKLFCANGDVNDGATNGRHPPLGWEKKPTVKQELEAVEERMTEIEDASKKAKHIWTMGNHDARFEMRLAAQTPEYEGIAGFALKDHFPRWKLCMSTWVNENVVIKHRYKGGIHATHNNTIGAGMTIVTGHLHSLKVTPYSDYRGIRWGVDTGTLADPYGPQFTYSEDNPLNHRSGFAVLTFYRGLLLWPELAYVIDENHISFRGKVIEI